MTKTGALCALALSILPPRQIEEVLYFIEQNLGVCMFFVLLLIFLVYTKLQDGNEIPTTNNAQRKKAIYQPPPKRLLTNAPSDSIILGKWKNQYVVKPLTESGHLLLIGGSGSGKSSCLAIPTLLANKSSSVFAIDVKGELSLKGVGLHDEKNVVFNPINSNTYGYDPFFQLHGNEYSEQVLYDTIEQICNSLLPINPSERDPYWTLSGRSLLTGLMIYEYRCGHTNLIDIIDQIKSCSVQTLLQEIKEDSSPSLMEYRMLSQFFDLSDTTLGSIYSTAMQRLSIFTADTNLRYALRDNPKKMTPQMLEDKKNIFLSIPEECLEKYSTILHLIINQAFSVLTKRSETAPPICFMIDELPRLLSIGKISSLLDAARTLRSRNVTLFLVVQSLEALEIAFTSKEATDLISNCSYIVVLSANSEDTIRKVKFWIGNYMEPHYSYNGTGADAKVTIAYNEKPIIEGKELMTLVKSGEAIVITPDGYCRLKKAFYFNDNYFSQLHKKVYEKNLEQQLDKTNEIHIENTSSPPPMVSESDKEQLLEWEESLISFDDITIEPNEFDFHST